MYRLALFAAFIALGFFAPKVEWTARSVRPEVTISHAEAQTKGMEKRTTRRDARGKPQK